ncbi:MAG: hypothetical protein ACOC5S_05650 [Acidobacteriota bacterium]
MKKLCMILSLALILCFMVGCQQKGDKSGRTESKMKQTSLVSTWLSEIPLPLEGC